LEFRPCIDIHNGKVKQIVGASLKDQENFAKENFISTKDAEYYADLYKSEGISGGHIILLNGAESEYFEATREQAVKALQAYPGGLQVGGGIRPENASFYLDAGASHVIVTSYVFQNGRILYDKLDEMVKCVGKDHLVLDVSCKKRDDDYFVVTDRWQNMTREKVTLQLLHELASYCDEFLIHAVDVEGKANGIEKTLAVMLGEFCELPVTYAGGVHSYEDIRLLKTLSEDRLNVTIGSALDLFGGELSWKQVMKLCNETCT